VFAINHEAVRTRGSGGSLKRFDQVAAVLTGNPSAEAADAINWLAQLIADLRVPSLASYGIKRQDFPEIVKKSAAASSMKANPVALSTDEMIAILERAF
jgi:alcohol dehydrogenase class IV